MYMHSTKSISSQFNFDVCAQCYAHPLPATAATIRTSIINICSRMSEKNKRMGVHIYYIFIYTYMYSKNINMKIYMYTLFRTFGFVVFSRRTTKFSIPKSISLYISER